METDKRHPDHFSLFMATIDIVEYSCKNVRPLIEKIAFLLPGEHTAHRVLKNCLNYMLKPCEGTDNERLIRDLGICGILELLQVYIAHLRLGEIPTNKELDPLVWRLREVIIRSFRADFARPFLEAHLFALKLKIEVYHMIPDQWDQIRAIADANDTVTTLWNAILHSFFPCSQN